MGLGDINVHFIDSAQEAIACVQWFSEHDGGTIAVDTETQGLHPHVDKVRLIQVGDERTAWCFPAEGPRSWGGLALDLLERFTGTFVYHNRKFDERALRATCGYEIPLERSHDTMLMTRVAEPTKSAALKRLAAQLVDPRAAILQGELDSAMKAGGHDWRTVPLDFQAYWLYGGIDTCLTKAVYDELEPKIEPYRDAYELELATTAVAARMEDYGAHIDVEFARKMHDDLLGYVDQVADYCQTTYGVHPGKNQEVVGFLQGQGIEFTTLTRGGSIALDAEVLEGITHPLAEIVLGRRKAQKIARTYLRHFHEDVDLNDVIHPSINTCQAVTSRMSMSSPNLQNLPRTNTNQLAKLVRACITPREGHVLLMCDFDQIEWRLFASDSGDKALVEAFNADDFFTEIARMVFNDLTIVKKDARRQITKNAMYAQIYGAGAQKFAWTAGVSLADAKQFLALLDQRMPAIRALQQRIIREGEAHHRTEGIGWIEGMFTHRRHVLDDDKIYKLVNYRLQGGAADVFKRKLVQLSQQGLDGMMVAPVHDEIILDVPIADFHDVAHILQRTMNDSSITAVPITASVSYGFRWSEKHDYDPSVVL